MLGGENTYHLVLQINFIRLKQTLCKLLYDEKNVTMRHISAYLCVCNGRENSMCFSIKQTVTVPGITTGAAVCLREESLYKFILNGLSHAFLSTNCPPSWTAITTALFRPACAQVSKEVCSLSNQTKFLHVCLIAF